ncbi:MAG: hypothetical protein AB3N16_06380 [Flavobacteriaceae bacterium]
MWQSIPEKLSKDTVRYTISDGSNFLTFSDWLDLISTSNAFIEFYTDILVSSAFEAFFWEVRPVNDASLHQKFQFVLVNGKSLAQIQADPSSFKQQFREGESVVSFPNLGGDALLLVPTPIDETTDYAHMAKFVRNAPIHQIRTFWKTVGKRYRASIGTKYTWLSTAGMGVSWLHVRIDEGPKYYRHSDYR